MSRFLSRFSCLGLVVLFLHTSTQEAQTKPRLKRTTGKASYYGPNFHLRSRTANGELMNMYKFTAAHRTLPFGTRVRVTNVKNGKSIIVRINDRGPFHGNRIIDLSLGAFKQIASRRSGIIRVKLSLTTKRPGVIVPALPGQELNWKMQAPIIKP